ncbi:hypothetical protein BDZ97DRAFT_1864540, partial [Flammula alnicola]
MNDSRAGFPEAETVFCGSSCQEVVDLLVDRDGASEILDAANLGLDQVVTVDGGGDGGGVHSSGHELEQGHLGSSILARNTIRTKFQVANTPHNVLVGRVVKMTIENLLGEGQRAVKPVADDNEVVLDALIVDVFVLLKKRHGDFGVANAWGGCGHAL